MHGSESEYMQGFGGKARIEREKELDIGGRIILKCISDDRVVKLHSSRSR
jgi:hypothetical protein